MDETVSQTEHRPAELRVCPLMVWGGGFQSCDDGRRVTVVRQARFIIQRADGQKWIKDRSVGIAPSTFATPWNVCTSILKMAHQEGFIPKYPCEGLKPPEAFCPEITRSTRRQ